MYRCLGFILFVLKYTIRALKKIFSLGFEILVIVLYAIVCLESSFVNLYASVHVSVK